MIYIKSTPVLRLFPLHSPPDRPLTGAEEAAAAVTSIAVIVNQRQVIRLLTIIILGGDINARAPFQRGEEGGGDAISHPLDNPVEPPAGWPGPVLGHRAAAPQTEEGDASVGGGRHGAEKGVEVGRMWSECLRGDAFEMDWSLVLASKAVTVIE